MVAAAAGSEGELSMPIGLWARRLSRTSRSMVVSERSDMGTGAQRILCLVCAQWCLVPCESATVGSATGVAHAGCSPGCAVTAGDLFNDLEAPPPAQEPGMPVEVTRCAPVQSTTALVEERFYTWTAPSPVALTCCIRSPMCSGSQGRRSGQPIHGFRLPRSDDHLGWHGA